MQNNIIPAIKVELDLKKVQDCIDAVNKCLNSDKYSLILVNMAQWNFAYGRSEPQKDLLELSMRNPRVKLVWSDFDGCEQTYGKICHKRVDSQGNEKQHPFFRIIIPNFNNIRYIEACLNSILKQSFQDFHIVCVDDLSTDGSDKICEDYAKKHPDKITFLRMEKKGHEGGCRNVGMNYGGVMSEYTYFVDGDDELYSQDALQQIYDATLDGEYDIILVGIVQKMLSTGKLVFNKHRTFDQTSREMLLSQWNSASAKVVRSSFEMPFLEGCDHGADVYQFTRLLNKVPRIKQTDINVYLYKRNPYSLTMSKDNTKYKDDTILFYKELLKLMLSCDNSDVRKAIEYRVALFNNGTIKN